MSAAVRRFAAAGAVAGAETTVGRVGAVFFVAGLSETADAAAEFGAQCPEHSHSTALASQLGSKHFEHPDVGRLGGATSAAHTVFHFDRFVPFIQPINQSINELPLRNQFSP